MNKTYATRTNAVRAARQACRLALRSKIFQAFEGPDYIIHPVDDDSIKGGTYRGPSRFELRGPAREALDRC